MCGAKEICFAMLLCMGNWKPSALLNPSPQSIRAFWKICLPEARAGDRGPAGMLVTLYFYVGSLPGWSESKFICTASGIVKTLCFWITRDAGQWAIPRTRSQKVVYWHVLWKAYSWFFLGGLSPIANKGQKFEVLTLPDMYKEVPQAFVGYFRISRLAHCSWVWMETFLVRMQSLPTWHTMFCFHWSQWLSARWYLQRTWPTALQSCEYGIRSHTLC